MNYRKWIIIQAVVTGVVLIATTVYFILRSFNKKIAPNLPVYDSKEECEQKTNKICDLQVCDYIPKGKTFEQVCGKNFKKGWVPIVVDGKEVAGNAEEYKDYHRCASRDLISRDNCYRLSAIANSDISICSYIQDSSAAQYLKNNCILITEAVNKSIYPLICQGLDRASCEKQQGCTPSFVSTTAFNPAGKPEKNYADCVVDEQYFCTGSGGNINVSYECECPNEKTYIKPYGCFNCDIFSSSIARKECIELTKKEGDTDLKNKKDEQENSEKDRL